MTAAMQNVTATIFGIIFILLIAAIIVTIARRLSFDSIDVDDTSYQEEDSEEYFFIYASNANRYPYSAGCTRVIAPNREAAEAVFRIYHPDFFPDLMSCAAVYAGDEFRMTNIFGTGNYGEYEHETLVVSRRVLVKKEV